MGLPDEPVDLLLVEDNQYDAELALRAFRRNATAHRVQWVRDGEEALDFMFCAGKFVQRPAGQRPRLILLDLKLPRVDGLEVLRKLKGDLRTREVPVVMLTSSAEERDLAECYRLGVNSYIVKPVDFTQFVDLVANIDSYWMRINRLPAPHLP
ncbi:MAG TPA: response regulator [Aromatoleum sp.]|uniref:response regulator n=1 Tax=Aromatoleum sp. TaxID=2307007 RepID=UPI002B493B16|nr:response regulator [Aromatoleum sp.]HJV24988.1 response regulator [Aromatoleum sp.]